MVTDSPVGDVAHVALGHVGDHQHLVEIGDAQQRLLALGPHLLAGGDVERRPPCPRGAARTQKRLSPSPATERLRCFDSAAFRVSSASLSSASAASTSFCGGGLELEELLARAPAGVGAPPPARGRPRSRDRDRRTRRCAPRRACRPASRARRRRTTTSTRPGQGHAHAAVRLGSRSTRPGTGSGASEAPGGDRELDVLPLRRVGGEGHALASAWRRRRHRPPSARGRRRGGRTGEEESLHGGPQGEGRASSELAEAGARDVQVEVGAIELGRGSSSSASERRASSSS